MTLPPVDPAILTANPKFSAVYQDLLDNKLNPDGTTKILDPKVLKERADFAEELRKARMEVARREAIATGLRELSSEGSQLPEDLRELVAVIAAVLQGQVADEDRDLLQEDIAKFKENIDPLASALSATFTRDIGSLATILDPDDPPAPQDLAPQVSRLKTGLSTSTARLDSSRLALGPETAALHTLHRTALALEIAQLERVIHGSVARAAKARAEYLATVAEGMAKKLALQQQSVNSRVYSPEVKRVLKETVDEVERRKGVVRTRVREAEARLLDYGKVGGMEGVVREYVEVRKECEKVSGEIARLQGR